MNARDKEAIREKLEELRYMKQLYEGHKKKVLEKYKELRKKIIDNDNQIQQLKQQLCKNKHL
ncbi:hypothetical protein J5298_05560 [Riemerella anatipestifer]|nr:hypothetical protein RIA_0181 [Riemerella anatipestifer RA-GD]AKQ40731.1 hypothetical protein AS87_10595 [Riemerella anatipestifer Yb2]EFT36353.1 hypothetical protein RAYM_09190 [Riemerella anatipestifer RA-YM]MBT0534133.1 hypothetical protein [Riemerella anatipestifer]UVK80349.1 hypothetical protein [Riemerella phage vB_RanS_PT33]WGH49464.1 hypothetical protein CRP2_000023 [Riemerella phage vB_RanS_CRP2]WIR86183.1 hypothetical protein CRP12_000052 [Riemerella phage vB_RanS_CRP12]